MPKNNGSGDGLSVQWLQVLERPDRSPCGLQPPRVGEITAKAWVGRNLPAQKSIE